ncbi:efflux RND transporter periplasmic adaptor subunit [Propionivibrio sp.]|uniref:efflux RND transporter periplasmic adaptor subunit n=1 Tax=Propionivibrio sp. TaxID=2212460 RepID=UPI0039E31160
MKPLLKISLVSLLVLALAAGAGGYAYWRRHEAQAPENRYRLQTVGRGDITQTVSANGTLNPIVLVNVGTQVSGTVTRLYVDFNDKVEKNQPLLELDQSLLAAQARQSEANVGNVSATLDLARANEARMQALFAQEYVSRQELDQAVQARKSAEAQLAQARAAAEKDRVNLGYTVIRSPVSGIVVDRVVDLGQTVAASYQTPTLIKIAQDLSEMRIDSSFAEADIGKIKEGQKVRFTVDAFPDRSFTGEVQQIRMNPTTTQNVVTYNVRVSLANPDHILLPGMTAYVNIGVAESRDVLLVPNAALRFKPAEADEPASGNGTQSGASGGQGARNGEAKGRGKKREGSSGRIYVVEGRTIRPVQVQLGITDNRNTEIVGGDLKEGDTIVVSEAPTAATKPSSVGMRLF